MAVQIFLRNEIFSSAGNTHDPYPLINFIEFGLIFKTARVEVHRVTKLTKFASKFKDINNLSTGIGGT
ncbi:hypothetical protein D3C72_2415550 [compost metagenome]